MPRTTGDGSDIYAEALDALPYQLAVIDEGGGVVAVNRAWEMFGQENGAPPAAAAMLGMNYLDICRKAADEGNSDAAAAMAGLEAVLQRRSDLFEMEYACHAPVEQRWFVMKVAPIERDGHRWAVVSHSNITTARNRATLSATADALAGERERAEARESDERSRELEAVAGVGRSPLGGVTATALGVQPLRECNPNAFEQAVAHYRRAIEGALEKRVLKGVPDPRPELKPLAAALGNLRAGPRDLVEIHLASIKALCSVTPSTKAYAFIEEGRTLLLELMGQLLSYYRRHHLSHPTGEERGEERS